MSNWQAVFTGPGSTPDWTILEGATYKEAIKNGDIVCTLPETTSRTAGKVCERARLIVEAPNLLRFAKAIEQVVVGAGHNLCSTATEEERTRFISGILDAWNNGGYEAIGRAKQ